MSIFNDRKPGTHETWLDDSGTLAHIAIVQAPGNPLCIYYNGVLVDLSAHRKPKSEGCRKRLAPGQYWGYCGETDMGQSAPALCTECGGEYKLDDQKEIDK